MNRRTVIGALGAMAAAGIAAQAHAQHEHHAGHGAGSSPYAKLQVAASLCVANGQVCLAHCIRLLGQGQKVGTVEGEYADPVDAPIITIIAAHCGPLAVSKE